MSSSPRHLGAVLAVSSNKGGVGKTTLATNLAIYVRALREDLPVLVVSLDDQHGVDRMLALRELGPADGNLKHGWAERSFERVIQLGNYGVHFVPSPPNTELLKARAEDPRSLRRILDQTAWDGLVIVDTKSDLEALTRNALHAADRVLIPICDWASLEEAAKGVAMLEGRGLGRDRVRIVFTLVDSRTRAEGGGREMASALRHEVERRRWPIYRTSLSRSPRVEALTAGTRTPRSILHYARGTRVHQQMRELTEEVIRDLDLDAVAAARSNGRHAPVPPIDRLRASGVADWKAAFFRGLRSR